MSAFTSRSGGYKGGVFLFLFAFVVFVVGYASPYWATYDYISYKSFEGPWMLCVSGTRTGYTNTACATYSWDQPGWFHAVRALEAIGLVLLIIAAVYCMATNCCRTFPGPRTRVLEALAGIGGVLGVVGVIVYGALRNDVSSIEYTMDWALYLAGVGSGLVVVAAIFIGVSNHEIEQPPPGTVIGMAPVTVVNSQQASYPAYAGGQPGYAPAQPGYAGGYPAQYPAYGHPGHGGAGGYPPPQAGYGGKY